VNENHGIPCPSRKGRRTSSPKSWLLWQPLWISATSCARRGAPASSAGGAALGADSLASQELHTFHECDTYNPIDPARICTGKTTSALRSDWFLPRPLGMVEASGMMLPLWEDALPNLPDEELAAAAKRFAAKM
jgi:hypothetical protein